jgi:hypothetical protein
MRWRSATGVLDALEVPADRAAWILIASVMLSQVLKLKTRGLTRRLFIVEACACATRQAGGPSRG